MKKFLIIIILYIVGVSCSSPEAFYMSADHQPKDDSFKITVIHGDIHDVVECPRDMFETVLWIQINRIPSDIAGKYFDLFGRKYYMSYRHFDQWELIDSSGNLVMQDTRHAIKWYLYQSSLE